jgi:hypothetical protein
LLRTPLGGAEKAPEAAAGPLRILFMACAPDGTEPVLQYEREEEIILDALVAARDTGHTEVLKGFTDYNDKIIYILSNVLGTKETLYLVDNFEDNLKRSEQFRAFKNSFWEGTFTTLIEELPHTLSRLLITCRYTIPGIGRTFSIRHPSGRCPRWRREN